MHGSMNVKQEMTSDCFFFLAMFIATCVFVNFCLALR